jgi:hypothetical protein
LTGQELADCLFQGYDDTVLTVDASVFVNALNPIAEGASESELFLERLRPTPLVLTPTEALAHYDELARADQV